jgi:signal transduction histidine kinase/Na+/proline symporter
MTKFIGTLSVAESMGRLYGSLVQRITAIFSIFLCAGIISLQFKVSASVMSIFFGVSGFYAVAISAVVVILYSSVGGIRAVTFTDIIQFFTFGTIIPIISFVIWMTLKDPHASIAAITENPLFNIYDIVDFSNPKFLNSLLLLLFFFIPALQPVFFQRVMMARNLYQARRSFVIAGIITLMILLITMWLGILLLVDNPELDPDNLLSYLINKHSYTGFKGFVAIGIMSIIMSTADSYINTASVIFSNDLLKLSSKNTQSLSISKIFAFFVGGLAFLLAFKASSILNLLIIVIGFYMPIVSVPLLFGIFGFKTSARPVLVGMFAGFSVITISNFVSFGFDPLIPAMVANSFCLICTHYILREEGGWIGNGDNQILINLRDARQRRYERIIKNIKEFRFLDFCENNTPKIEATYVVFGIFSLVSVFSSMYNLSSEIRSEYSSILNFIYDSTLLYSCLFLTYPIWPGTLRNKKFIGVAWVIGAPYILIFANGLLVLISNLEQLQLMIFMINIIIVAIVMRWYLAVISVSIGLLVLMKFYTIYIASDNHVLNFNLDLRFKTIYMLLLISSVLIAFIKPKQEYEESSEAKILHLSHNVDDRETELEKALDLKHEFLRNINHEIRTPLMGIGNISIELSRSWDKLSNDQRKQYAKIVADSSDRLTSLMLNILDFSKLSSNNYKLDLEEVNLGELIEQRMNECKMMYYASSKDVDFIINAKEPIKLQCDKYYISQLLDNLILNAIRYGQNSLVEVTINIIGENRDFLELSIKDDGIGILEEDYDSIFMPFIVGSKTKSRAGGRGMGLAVCKKIIEVHNGDISISKNNITGSSFVIKIPLEQKNS